MAKNPVPNLQDQHENVDPRDQPKVNPESGAKAAQEQPGPAIEVDEGKHKPAGKGKGAKEETRPPEGASASEAMEYLKQGDTSVLYTMAPDQVACVRPMFKEWAKAEQDRLKVEYDRVYNEILATMNALGVVY